MQMWRSTQNFISRKPVNLWKRLPKTGLWLLTSYLNLMPRAISQSEGRCHIIWNILTKEISHNNKALSAVLIDFTGLKIYWSQAKLMCNSVMNQIHVGNEPISLKTCPFSKTSGYQTRPLVPVLNYQTLPPVPVIIYSQIPPFIRFHSSPQACKCLIIISITSYAYIKADPIITISQHFHSSFKYPNSIHN